MVFTVVNKEISVKKIQISSLSSSSSLFIGDVKSVTLSSWFDTPPEKMIVGATIGAPEQRQASD